MDLTDLFRVKDPDVNADYSLMMDCEMGEVMRFVMNYKSGKNKFYNVAYNLKAMDSGNDNQVVIIGVPE